MKQWFNNLRRQEQLMVLVGGAVVAVYVVFVFILGPMADTRDKLQRQNQAAATTLAEVKALAEQYRRLQGGGSPTPATGGSLTRIVDTTVKHNQLSMSRFQPSSSGDVQVRFENALFNNLVAWLNELEVENGVLIKDLSITPGSGTGLVNVSVRLSLNG